VYTYNIGTVTTVLYTTYNIVNVFKNLQTLSCNQKICQGYSFENKSVTYVT